jgi:drug/metabolite transporter (DMT)-like permease
VPSGLLCSCHRRSSDTDFNLALRYVHISIVSGTILAEPVVAALLAWLVLPERPGPLTIVGGAVVLAGLYFLLKGRSAAGEPNP